MNNQQQPKCVICGNPDADIVWFQTLYFCGPDNELFETLWLERVINPSLKGVEIHESALVQKSWKKNKVFARRDKEAEAKTGTAEEAAEA